MFSYINNSEKPRLSELESWLRELGTVMIRLGPVLEKLDESYLNSNLNRNYLGRKQTVRKLYNFNGNIL